MLCILFSRYESLIHPLEASAEAWTHSQRSSDLRLRAALYRLTRVAAEASMVLSPMSTRRPPRTDGLTLLVKVKVLPSANGDPFKAFSMRVMVLESRDSAEVTTTSSSPRYADMSWLKSAKTLGAEERRPFSERTLRRLKSNGEEPEGSTFFKTSERSLKERVGLSADESKSNADRSRDRG